MCALYKGSEIVAGLSKNTIVNGFHLFDFKWSDKRLNDISWLESSTFSWHSGDVYTTAYNKLVEEYNSVTDSGEALYAFTVDLDTIPEGETFTLPETLYIKDAHSSSLYTADGVLYQNANTDLSEIEYDEDVIEDAYSSITVHSDSLMNGEITYYRNVALDKLGNSSSISEGGVTFKRSANGFKIADASQEANILAKYNSDGIAWYYILDTENKRFKLPRTKFGFEGLRTNAGDDIVESLPNIKREFNGGRIYTTNDYNSGVVEPFIKASVPTYNPATSGSAIQTSIIGFDASLVSSTYQDNAPVQERATQMYLYFYVGEYAREAIEQTAGLNAEMFNNKVDKSGDTIDGNLTVLGTIIGGNSTNRLGNIEFYGGGTSYGGFIDFHYGNSTTDYTSRIIENASGVISINGSNGVYLKHSYVNGTSGYNIWTNGYCEQWGKTTASGTINISFVKHFKDTNYNLITQYYSGSDSNDGFQNITTSGFQKRGTNAGDFMWKASGYLAEGQY